MKSIIIEILGSKGPSNYVTNKIFFYSKINVNVSKIKLSEIKKWLQYFIFYELNLL